MFGTIFSRSVRLLGRLYSGRGRPTGRLGQIILEGGAVCFVVAKTCIS